MAKGLQNIFGNVTGTLTGGLTDASPDWMPAQLDAGSQSIIDQQLQDSHLSDQEILNRQLNGTSQTMPDATGGQVAVQQNTLGGAADPSVSKALNDRANRLYSSQYNQLQNQAISNIPVMRGRLMGQAGNALEEQQKINDALNRYQTDVTMQKENYRNQLIGNLFGGAGSFAGGYFGRQAMRNNGNGIPDSSNYNSGTNNVNYRSQGIGQGFGPGQYWDSGNQQVDNPNSPRMVADNSGYGLGRTFQGMG